jgi:glycosyltransferase involved in cell wall biosynthesis
MKVSVLMITYNHEKFIAQAIESILMQVVDFDYEIVIGEDCSTDQTREIVCAYQNIYPEIIKLFLPSQNIGVNRNFEQVLKRCKGEYVALLEGDDYWSENHKLQRQVNFLDQHPDCMICCHDVQVIYEYRNSPSHLYCTWKQSEFSELQDLLKRNFIATPSALFRNNLFDQWPDWFYDVKLVDWVLHILNAQFGKIGYINQNMAVYRVHANGIWSSAKDETNIEAVIQVLEKVDNLLHYKYTKEIRFSSFNFYTVLLKIGIKKRRLKIIYKALLKIVYSLYTVFMHEPICKN